MENNDFDIFNMSPEDMVEPKTESRESDFYKPDPKKGKDNVYKALVKFVLNPKDPKKKSKIKKYSYWLTDPLTGDGFSVDCPSTINQKSVLQDTFWKLKKSQSVSEQKLSEKFKRRENYYALVQILKDEQNPSLVGKIKIFKFGQKVNKMIQDELQPEFGQPNNIWDPMKGKVFQLVVNISGGFNNYDNCKFVGSGNPVILADGTPVVTPENIEKFKEQWSKNSPDLSICDYQEWSDETRDKVKSVIENTVPALRTTESLSSGLAKTSSSATNISLDETPATRPHTPAENAAPAEVNLNDLNLDDLNKVDDFNSDLYGDL
jgi:hypothetical protein